MLIGMVRPVSKLLWFTYRIGTFLGHRWSGGLWVFLFSIMIFLKKCMPDYHHIHRELSSREAKYKKVHARVKLCAESIAFFGGGERERQVAMRSFESVQELEWERAPHTALGRGSGQPFARANEPRVVVAGGNSRK